MSYTYNVSADKLTQTKLTDKQGTGTLLSPETEAQNQLSLSGAFQAVTRTRNFVQTTQNIKEADPLTQPWLVAEAINEAIGLSATLATDFGISVARRNTSQILSLKRNATATGIVDAGQITDLIAEANRASKIAKVALAVDVAVTIGNEVIKIGQRQAKISQANRNAKFQASINGVRVNKR